MPNKKAESSCKYEKGEKKEEEREGTKRRKRILVS